MATEFIMPKLGLTMEEGTITEWYADDGDTVTAGAAILRIETDKTETDVEAAGSGRLHRLGQVGETFACGELIGFFLADDEPAPAPKGAAGPAAAPTVAPTAQVAEPAVGAAAVAPTGRIMASPLAKRLANERNIDLRAIDGTGPGGRIVSEDLDGVAPSPTSTASAPAIAPLPGSAGREWRSRNWCSGDRHRRCRSRRHRRRPPTCRPARNRSGARRTRPDRTSRDQGIGRPPRPPNPEPRR